MVNKKIKYFWAVTDYPNLTLVGYENEIKLEYFEYTELLADRVLGLAEQEYDRDMEYGDMQTYMNQFIPPQFKIFNLKQSLADCTLGHILVDASLQWGGLDAVVNLSEFPITLVINKDYEQLYHEDYDRDFIDWLADAFPGHKN